MDIDHAGYPGLRKVECKQIRQETLRGIARPVGVLAEWKEPDGEQRDDWECSKEAE